MTTEDDKPPHPRQQVLDYWFGDEAEPRPIPERWFAGTPEIDAEIRERFADRFAIAAAGGCDDWLETPLGARRVEFRQLDSATEAGRLLRVVVVTYHPLLENGLLDLDDLRSVTLPAVNQQYELLELLQQHAPQPAQPLSRE